MPHFLTQAFYIAFNTWKEAARDRSIYILFLSGFAVLLLSLVLGNMSFGVKGRIIQNMGFWMLGLWGLISIMYLGSNIIKKEFKQKTVYLILSRPIQRPTFLLGKYLGIILVLITLWMLLTAAWLIFIFSQGIQVTSQHFIATLFIFFEWLLLASISLFFATFTTPLLHNFFLACVYIVGHLSNDVLRYSKLIESNVLSKFLQYTYYAIPNLEALNFRKEALYELSINPSLYFQGVVCFLLWIAFFLACSNAIFLTLKIK